MKMTNIRKGFTLIELLVVISIIGILAALATVSFTSSQKQARDTQRKSDLKQYQGQLETFANQNDGIYPSRTASAGVVASTILCADLGLTDCPEDPKTSDSGPYYRYQSNGSGNGTISATNYVFWADLEGSDNYYWVVCSTGQSGKIDSDTSFSDGGCPSGLE